MSLSAISYRLFLEDRQNPIEVAELFCSTNKRSLLQREILSEKSFHVYVDMVGDLFHAGHMNLVRQALLKGRDLAEGRKVQVIVGLNSDEECESYKRRPMNTLAERVAAAVQCCHVDAVLFPAPLVISNEIMDELMINLVVHGDDFDSGKLEKYYSVPISRKAFATVPYTKGISTSELIRRIQFRPAV